MNLKKTIEIGLKINADDEGWNQRVGTMAKSLQKGLTESVKAAFGGAPGGGAGAPGAGAGMGAGMDSFFKSMQALRNNADNAMKSHAKEQMKLMKDLSKEEEKLAKLRQDQSKLSKEENKDLKEKLRLKRELANTESEINRIQSEYGKRQVTFDAAKGAVAGGTQPVFVTNWPDEFGGGGSGGGGGSRGGGRPGGGRGAGMRGIGRAIGAAGAVLSAIGAGIDQWTQLPLTRTASLGSATQSLIGSNLQEISQGNVVSTMGWMPERLRAMQMAQDRLQGQQTAAPFRVLQGAAGLVKGAMGGGGGGAGGFDADANYLSGVLAKGFEKVFSVGGLVPNIISKRLAHESEQYFTTHQAQLMEDFGKNYESMLQAQQKENPLKNLAVNYFQDRYKTDLQSQRMMGLGDQGFYGRGGFMERANMAGFTGDMAVEQARAIQAAGGSTRGMQGNALTALKAARGFDLTNAGSIMGTISGGVGDAATSERILKRILAEGMKDGLDKSDAVEELRRYSQMTAEVVSETGATSDADIQRIIEGFNRFQAGGIPTIREQQGAMSAYREYQGFSAETAGRGGAMQFAAIQKQGLGGVDPNAIGQFMEMPEKDITEKNPLIVAMAVDQGMRPADLARKIINAKREKARTEVGIRPEWQQTLKRAGITGPLSEEELMQQPTDVRTAYTEIAKRVGAKSKYENIQKWNAVFRGYATGTDLETGEMVPEIPKDVEDKFDKGRPADEKRAADEAVRSAGVAAQAMLENFREFKDVITPSADALSDFTKQMIIFAQVMSMTTDADKAATLKGLMDQYRQRQGAATGAGTAPTSNPQAGKPMPGGRQRLSGESF